jgi:hypothetical protein
MSFQGLLYSQFYGLDDQGMRLDFQWEQEILLSPTVSRSVHAVFSPLGIGGSFLAISSQGMKTSHQKNSPWFATASDPFVVGV